MRRDEVRAWVALLGAMSARDVARGALRRARRRRGIARVAAVTDDEANAAGRALAAAPRILGVDARQARALHRLVAPEAARRARRRAEAILDGAAEVFGRPVDARAGRIDWHLDPLSGRRFDPTMPAGAVPLLDAGADARAVWELSRAGHLVALAVAGALHPAMGAVTTRAVLDGIEDFTRANPTGRGVHWASPLEAGLRVIAWAQALELSRATGHADGAALARAAGAIREHARFLAANPEDGGLVVGTHRLGVLVGQLAAGVVLGALDEGARIMERALAGIAGIAASQAATDGGPAEGSTSYHRFAIELLVWADRLAAAAGRDAGVRLVLRRMLRCAAECAGPDGSDPAIGDGDDSALLPPGDRGPRDHGHLPGLGAALLGDAALRRGDDVFPVEAIWIAGPRGYRRFRAMTGARPRRVAVFPSGGVHVLREGGDQVVLRCGPHGQRGAGGHAHGDQLSVVAFLDGTSLVVEAGTFGYTRDPMWRDRFRGTAAHSTVVIGEEEQTPMHDARPFALPDGAGARLVDVGDDAASAWLVGETRYGGRDGRYRHRREVRLPRGGGAIVVRDRLEGPGSPPFEARFQLADAEARLASEEELDAIARALSRIGETRGFGAVVCGGAGRRFALASVEDTPAPRIDRGWIATRFGERRPSTVARFRARRPLPSALAVAMILW